MGLVTKYFATVAAGSGDGSSAANAAVLFTGGAWSTTLTGFAFNGTDAMEARIMVGTYTITAGLVAGSFTNPPTIANPLIFHGADGSGNLLTPPDPNWTSDQPAFSTATLPLLQSSSNIQIINLGLASARLINFSSSASTVAVATLGVIDWCAGSNSTSGTGVSVFTVDGATNTFAKTTAASYSGVITSGNNGTLRHGNVRVEGIAGTSGTRYGLEMNAFGPTCAMDRVCVVGVGGVGLAVVSGNSNSVRISRSTLVNCLTGIQLQTGAAANVHVVEHCCITGCTTGVDGNTGLGVLVTDSRLRNTTNITNSGNYGQGYNNYTTAGTDAGDYSNPASGDYRILASAGFANRQIGVSQMSGAGMILSRVQTGM